jgi:hypothetical protein
VDELSRLVVGCRIHRGLQYRGWNSLLLQVDAAIGRTVNFDKLLEQVKGSNVKSLRFREKVCKGDTQNTHNVSSEELPVSRARITCGQYMFRGSLAKRRPRWLGPPPQHLPSQRTDLPFLAVSVATRNLTRVSSPDKTKPMSGHRLFYWAIAT